MNRNKNPATVGSLQIQKHYSAVWRSLDPTCQVLTASNVEGAVSMARKIGKQGMKAFVTGSLHLVGSVLYILDPDSPK